MQYKITLLNVAAIVTKVSVFQHYLCNFTLIHITLSYGNTRIQGKDCCGGTCSVTPLSDALNTGALLCVCITDATPGPSAAGVRL